jgi:hypothetical protein
MMLCIDGAEIDVLTLALGTRVGDDVVVLVHETFSCRLGDELAVVEEFLARQDASLFALEAFGVVTGPGSAGALRSTLSLVNACALGSEKFVYALTHEHDSWHIVSPKRPYVLPVYDRPAHTTPSRKDALGRFVVNI